MPGEPDAITAGDTLAFTHTDSVYQISDWSLTYNLLNASNFYSFRASSPSTGYDFSVSVAATTTSTWQPGIYRWVARVVNGVTLETLTIEQGTLEILPNWATLTSGYDYRSHVKKTLDALEATIMGKASSDQLAYTIGNRSLQRMKPEELLVWRDKYKAEYEAELRAEDVAGEGNAGRILVRFV